MASSSLLRTTTACKKCSKAKGIFRCSGCEEYFCSTHSNEHRLELEKEMDMIETEYNSLQETLHRKMDYTDDYPIFEKLKRWEQESIEKIHKKAEEFRQKIFDQTKVAENNMKMKLETLSTELRNARKENDFLEHDLVSWTKYLEQIKNELIHLPFVSLENDWTILIHSIRLQFDSNLDRFDKVFGNGHIEFDGKLAKKDENESSHCEFRGKNEYSNGIHQISFQIKKLPGEGWIAIGIVHQSETMRTNSYNSPSIFCWSNKDQTYVAGVYSSKETFSIVENDLITLTVDCQKTIIQLRNNRLNQFLEMPVELRNCPFPWQFHVNIHQSATEILIVD